MGLDYGILATPTIRRAKVSRHQPERCLETSHGGSRVIPSPATPLLAQLSFLSRFPSIPHTAAARNGMVPSRQKFLDALGEDLLWANVVRRVEARISRRLFGVDGNTLFVGRHGRGQGGADH